MVFQICEQQGRDGWCGQHAEWSQELGWTAGSAFGVHEDGAGARESWRVGSEGRWWAAV